MEALQIRHDDSNELSNDMWWLLWGLWRVQLKLKKKQFILANVCRVVSIIKWGFISKVSDELWQLSLSSYGITLMFAIKSVIIWSSDTRSIEYISNHNKLYLHKLSKLIPQTHEMHTPKECFNYNIKMRS